MHQAVRDRAHNQRRGPAANTSIRNKIKARDGYRCRLCGSSVQLEVHHVVPISRGGHPTDENNLVTLCHQCHLAMHHG
jgi:5-methylcytosine-specific restriction endonuclease McrA